MCWGRAAVGTPSEVGTGWSRATQGGLGSPGVDRTGQRSRFQEGKGPQPWEGGNPEGQARSVVDWGTGQACWGGGGWGADFGHLS